MGIETRNQPRKEENHGVLPRGGVREEPQRDFQSAAGEGAVQEHVEEPDLKMTVSKGSDNLT